MVICSVPALRPCLLVAAAAAQKAYCQHHTGPVRERVQSLQALNVAYRALGAAARGRGGSVVKRSTWTVVHLEGDRRVANR